MSLPEDQQPMDVADRPRLVLPQKLGALIASRSPFPCLAIDETHEVVWCNKAAVELFGEAKIGYVESYPADHIQALTECFRSQKEQKASWDYDQKRIEGTYLYEGKGGLVYFYGHETTSHSLEREELASKANRDEMTQLPNHGYFDQVVEEEIAQGKRVAIIFLDVDHFKSVNDKYSSHLIGNEVLIEVGLRLREVSRGFVARLHGDEFAILVASNNRNISDERFCQEVAMVAGRVLRSIRKPFNVDRSTKLMEITVSLGIGTDIDLPRKAKPDKKRARIYERADRAVYAAKSEGKDRYVFYEPTMTKKHSQKAP